MRLNIFLGFLLSIVIANGCIKDDFIDDAVDPILRITSSLDTLAINTSFQFEAMYLNNIGREEEVSFDWKSTNPEVLNISSSGLSEATLIGSSTVYVEYKNGSTLLKDSLLVFVGENTSITSQTVEGNIQTTSSYLLEGDFSLSESDGNLELVLADNYKASTALPGLYIYLSNNRNTINDAYEVGAVQVFSGSHSYTIPNTSISDYSYILYFCKPFNVKVGDGQIQ